MRVLLEVEDEPCHVMTSHKVVTTLVRDILRVEDLSSTCICFHHQMTRLMRHIFCVFNLINTLRGGSHYRTTSSSSIEPSTSYTPPHGPPPPPNSPPHNSAATSIGILASPLHLFELSSMFNPPPPLVSPPHVFECVSTSIPPHFPPPSSPPYVSPYSIDPTPRPVLMSPSNDHFIYPIPHVSSSIDPLPPPIPPHVSNCFDSLDTMITSGTIAPHIHDIDRETLDNTIFPTFVFDIVVLDRGSTSSSRDTKAILSTGGPR